MAPREDAIPRGLLSEGDAALWLGGVSVNFLRDAGIPRRMWKRRRFYDVRDLAAFRDALPYEGEDGTVKEDGGCHANEVFG